MIRTAEVETCLREPQTRKSKTLSECQEAVGEVVHTKKMDDGDYKFLLNVEDKYKYLLNEKNDEKTDGYLVVEIVPPDQGKSGVILPKEGSKVIWGTVGY